MNLDSCILDTHTGHLGGVENEQQNCGIESMSVHFVSRIQIKKNNAKSNKMVKKSPKKNPVWQQLRIDIYLQQTECNINA